MAESVFKTTVKREKDYIYFCKDQDGFVAVWRAKMGRTKGSK